MSEKLEAKHVPICLVLLVLFLLLLVLVLLLLGLRATKRWIQAEPDTQRLAADESHTKKFQKHKESKDLENDISADQRNLSVKYPVTIYGSS